MPTIGCARYLKLRAPLFDCRAWAFDWRPRSRVGRYRPKWIYMQGSRDFTNYPGCMVKRLVSLDYSRLINHINPKLEQSKLPILQRPFRHDRRVLASVWAEKRKPKASRPQGGGGSFEHFSRVVIFGKVISEQDGAAEARQPYSEPAHSAAIPNWHFRAHSFSFLMTLHNFAAGRASCQSTNTPSSISHILAYLWECVRRTIGFGTCGV